MDRPNVADFPDVIGKTIDEAKEILAPYGVNRIRPRTIDGKPQMGTTDVATDRLNVSLNDGVISSVGNIG